MQHPTFSNSRSNISKDITEEILKIYVAPCINNFDKDRMALEYQI
jgi:hypothetical protein